MTLALTPAPLFTLFSGARPRPVPVEGNPTTRGVTPSGNGRIVL